MSRQMQRMPRRDTKPEVALRKELHARGLRFRKQFPSLPGRPDLAFTRARLAVFVDGCFWHSCPLHATRPKNNAAWWETKLAANVARDRRQDQELVDAGWTVVRIWEHEPVSLAADRIEAMWRTLLGEPPRR
ncbi:very short patch repair endonuclease [Blastococcus sp. SYSU D00813]